MDAWLLTTVLVRWLVCAGALLAAGTVLFLAAQPRLARRCRGAGSLPRRAALRVVLGIACVGLVALVHLVLRDGQGALGALLAVGAGAFVAGRLASGRDAAASEDPDAIGAVPGALRATVRLASVAAAAAALGTLAGIALQAGHLLDEGWRGTVDPEMLALVATSPSGTAALVRLAGLALVLTLHRDGVCPASLVGAALVIASFALSGHATMEPRLTASVLLAAHLGAASFWIGALHPLHCLAASDATRAESAIAAERFGQQAGGAVLMLVVVGTAYAGLLVEEPSVLVDAPYGRTLALKALLMVPLFELAALNRWYFAPRLASAAPPVAARGARGLRRLIGLEALTFLAILLAAAVLSGGRSCQLARRRGRPRPGRP